MKRGILILAVSLIVAVSSFLLLCPPYPQLWKQIAIGMCHSDIERIAVQNGGDRVAVNGNMTSWEVKRGLGRFSIQITFFEEKAALLHCQYRSDVSTFLDRARNKQRE